MKIHQYEMVKDDKKVVLKSDRCNIYKIYPIKKEVRTKNTIKWVL